MMRKRFWRGGTSNKYKRDVKFVLNNMIPVYPRVTMRLIRINTNNYFNNLVDFFLFHFCNVLFIFSYIF